MPSLQLFLRSNQVIVERKISIDRLVIAGWTGRNAVATEEQIGELEKLGVARPNKTPMFYEIAAQQLSIDPSIQVVGRDSTGEVECVYLMLEDGVWVGLGSDHTDRKLETIGVTLSKQACAKPVSHEFWRLDELGRFDDLMLRSWATIGGTRRLYREGPVSTMRPPSELIGLWSGKSHPGTIMFGGTLPVKGEIAFADKFEMELEDPISGRFIRHQYLVSDLKPLG